MRFSVAPLLAASLFAVACGSSKPTIEEASACAVGDLYCAGNAGRCLELDQRGRHRDRGELHRSGAQTAVATGEVRFNCGTRR